MTDIIKTGDYTLSATVTPIARPAGHYHLRFTSQLNTAKNPDESRTVFQFTGGSESLRALRDAINEAL